MDIFWDISDNCIGTHCTTGAAKTIQHLTLEKLTEFMLFMCTHFVGPLLAIKLRNSHTKQIKITICPVVEVDCEFKWHVHGLFTQKLNLLRSSLYFLPTAARADFYFKEAILPSVT